MLSDLEESFRRFWRYCVRAKDVLSVLQVSFISRKAAADDDDQGEESEDQDEDEDDNMRMSLSKLPFSQERPLPRKIHLMPTFYVV